MSLTTKRIVLLFTCILLLSFCSCNASVTESKVPAFPKTPDSMIVGSNGCEFEFLPNSEEFNKIYTYICGRVENSSSFDALRLGAYDEDGNHMSYEMRKSETFVEFIYNEGSGQVFLMDTEGGGVTNEERTVQKVFFPLSGERHNNFFVANDSEYKKSVTLGILTDDTSLITYVRELVAAK